MSDDVLRPRVIPDDGTTEGLSGFATPGDGGLALVGDAWEEVGEGKEAGTRRDALINELYGCVMGVEVRRAGYSPITLTLSRENPLSSRSFTASSIQVSQIACISAASCSCHLQKIIVSIPQNVLELGEGGENAGYVGKRCGENSYPGSG